MKILVIMKRFGANKDMVAQNFGRQIRLFENLSKKYTIHFFCPDYKKKENFEKITNKIMYIVRPLSITKIFSFFESLKKLISKGKYDCIFTTTDPLIDIMGYKYSKKFNIPLIVDLQDNYEIYDSYKIPFVKFLENNVIKNADSVITVSETLKKKISKLRKKPIITIQNGVDTKFFNKKDKFMSRKKLNLDKKLKIITYIGEISKHKGVDLLLKSFEIVKKEVKNSRLLLSGKVKDNINIKREGVIFEDLPKREDVVDALNASDVALIPNRKNVFSEYCFPYKLVEYMSCGISIISTKFGDPQILLSEDSLCNTDDVEDLAQKIILKLKKPKKEDYISLVKKFDWKNLSKKIEEEIISKI